jgi:predicted lipid carrier protein YhbT
VEGGSLRVTGADKRAPDVTMRGDIDSLLALFQRKVDADSLFFSRRLAIEGDVYASVFLKNLLESL